MSKNSKSKSLEKEDKNLSSFSMYDLKIKKDEEISLSAKQALITAKIDLVRTYPFLGFLVMSTTYKFSDSLPTMGATTIGGNTIFINEKFLLKILTSRKERAFVIAHEILHIFLEHIGRQREMTYNAALWNVATDFCINSFLIELSSKMLKMPEFGLYDKKYKGMSSDKIYHLLLKESDNNPKKAVAKFGDISDEGDGKRPFDKVSNEEVSETSKIENKQKLAASLAQNNINDIKNMGKGAADLIRQFQDLLESKIPWRQVLRDFITETHKSRYTYNRISRRSSGSVLFPSLTGEHINMVFGVDTSGSMSSKDLSEAMSELYAILEEFDSWNLTFLSCDSDAHVIGEYNSEEGDNFQTVDKSLIGGGGTDMNPMIRHANEMEETPSIIIILTDGFIPNVNTVDEIPAILVVTKDGNKDLTSESCSIIKMED